jgi:serine protease Do
MTSIWQQINEAAAASVTDVQRAVVQIRTDEGGIGAGTIWHSDGLIITSAHVVVDKMPRRNLKVVLYNGETHPAQVIAYDTGKDIAALNIDVKNLPVMPPGRSSDVLPGEWLMALGHPWGTPDVLTAGVVIGTGKNLPEADGRDWIALDSHMRPGHSGGPLFNTRGQLVGINTMIRGPQVSFAVPVDEVVAFLKESLGKGAPVPDDEPEETPAYV